MSSQLSIDLTLTEESRKKMYSKFQTMCKYRLMTEWLVLTVVYGCVSDRTMSLVSVLTFLLLQPAKRHSYAQNGCYPEERELIFDIVSESTF